MVEVVGAVAAVAQLAKYSFDICNDVPEIGRRLRHAPALLRQWDDHASLLVSLASLIRTLHTQPELLNDVPVEIINRVNDEAGKVAALLQKLAITAGDRRFARIKKHIAITRKEKEINVLLTSITQRSHALQAILVYVCINETSIGYLPRQRLLHNRTAQSCDSSPRRYMSADQQTQFNGTLPRLGDERAISNSPRPFFFMGHTSRNPDYVGRTDLHKILNKNLTNIRGARVAIAGLGGVGKSQLAIESAHMIHEVVPAMSIFWLDGSSQRALMASFHDINHSYGVAPCARSAGLSWLNVGPSGPYLIIVDNIDLTTMTPESLDELFPRHPNGHILFTTRSRQVALRLVHPKDVLEVSSMSIADARELLVSYAGPIRGSDEEVDAVLNRLDCYPLAIRQAGLHLRSTSMCLQEFLIYLECENKILFMDAFRSPLTLSNQPSRPPVLHPVFSIDALTFQNPAATRLLFILSCLHCSDIPPDIMSSLADTIDQKSAAILLKDYYILQTNSSNHACRLNTFARSITRAYLTSAPERLEYMELALFLVAPCRAPTCSLTANRDCGLYLHQLSTLNAVLEFSSAHELKPQTYQLIISLGARLCHHLIRIGNAREAIRLVTNIIPWATVAPHSNLAALEKLRSKHSAALYSVGKLEDAECMARKVLRSQVVVGGDKSMDTLHSLNNLGVIYQDQGRFSDAEHCHRKALEAKELLFGRQHLETLVSFSNLALSLQSQCNYRDAEDLFCRVLRGRRRLLTPNHVDVLVSMKNLGICYQRQGRLDEARRKHQTALDGLQRLFERLHPEIQKCKGNLALVLDRLGRHEEAIQLLRELSHDLNEVQGPSHPDTIKTLRNLAILLQRHSRLAEAETAIAKALANEEVEFGKGDQRTFPDLQYLSTLLHLQQKYEEALENALWLLESRSEILGSDHPDTLCSLAHVKELEEVMGLERVDSGISVAIIAN